MLLAFSRLQAKELSKFSFLAECSKAARGVRVCNAMSGTSVELPLLDDTFDSVVLVLGRLHALFRGGI